MRGALALIATVLATGAAWTLWPSQPVTVTERSTWTEAELASPTLIERGRYLATLGNCQGCHSVRGAAPYAGGTPLRTAFGTVFGPNLTPSPQGLGAWSVDDFWQALHHGQRPDGQLLTPVFPYPNTTHISRADSDALYSYLRSLPPDATPNKAHELAWPYNTQVALKVWRARYFTPATPTDAPSTAGVDPTARGRYLVSGLAHCSACHAPRDGWGGGQDLLALSGGVMSSGWYAPSLLDPREAGLQNFSLQQITELLGQGRSGQHGVSGPMADVVADSMRHWKPDDLQALAMYLQSLPTEITAHALSGAASVNSNRRAMGAKLYEKHCAACHGDKGEGYTLANGQVAYPALSGQRTVTMNSSANLAHIVMDGGFGVASAHEPRPFGMPPFVQTLTDTELAALLTYLRSAWGNHAPEVTDLELHRLRESATR